jgi:signal transduction histidine kinase
MTHEFQPDIDAIGRIPAVPTILDVVCRTTGMGFAAVARVTEDRWIACGVKDDIAFGLQPGGELKVETTICHEIRQTREAVVINHVADDPAYCSHHTPAMYGFQSYISMPILLPDGSFFGTLCAIDPKPHMLKTPEIIGMFKLFAELIAFHLDANARLAASEALLARERAVAELREQFIAVLGHDLRNPLMAVSAGAAMLARRPERAPEIVGPMERSIARMAGLIDNVLDFARGRMGGGIVLDRAAAVPVAPILHQVIEELRRTHPDRAMVADITSDAPVACDPIRIAQLFSNLLGNALTHGAPEQPIHVRMDASGGGFELAVTNGGAPIPADKLDRLFQPFFRGSDDVAREGLGLGLYIASEIARAHGGAITVTSDATETCFTFRMPAVAA